MVERSLGRREVIECLDLYLLLGRKFVSPPQIQLEIISRVPQDRKVGARDIAVTTAVQCYAPGVAKLKPRRDEKSVSIAESTLEGGHHTTRQHTHYTWNLIGVSRSVVHDVFHANPFYNSEQQSQRYVEAKQGSYLIPAGLTEEQEETFSQSADFANKEYFNLLKELVPEVNRRVSQMYPRAGWKVGKIKDRLDSKAMKLTQEIARYVLPIAQKTTMYHTLNELQLLRLFRASQMSHFSDEARYVVSKMIYAIAKEDSSILDELDTPLPLGEGESFQEKYIGEQKTEFDQTLQERQSLLLSMPENSREIVSIAVRNILGISSSQLSKEEAISLLMDPSQNELLADVYEVGMMDPLTSALRGVSVTFATRLSHTANSQRQRHRRTPGATPSIETIYDGTADYSTPLVIRKNPQLLELYNEIIVEVYNNVERVIQAGIPKEDALLLLPNAQNVRVVESGDLFDWVHRWKQRLCYLAQEEIFFISVEQVKQLGSIFPEADKLFLAPCGIRQKAGIRPRCPEGERWCGKPVFNWDIDDYSQNRLI